jgi:DNA-binding transcriptional ArsR family regulator
MGKSLLSKSQSVQTEDTPSCDAPLVHLEQVRQVQLEIMSVDKAQQMAEFFNALADPSRLRLMSALADRELCVCDLAAAVKVSESSVSHQLRILRSQRLVKYRREGRNVYYSLADHHIMSLYQDVSEHLKEVKD